MNASRIIFGATLTFLISARAAWAQQLPTDGPPLPGTQPLRIDGDLAKLMVQGIDKYLDRKLDEAAKLRGKYWNVDTTGLGAYAKSVEPNRQRLKKILGVVDERSNEGRGGPQLEVVASPYSEAKAIEKPEDGTFSVRAVRWPVFGNVTGEGLLLEPKSRVVGTFVAIPDADQTPEQIVGVTKGLPENAQFARLLANCGFRVVIPTIINRSDELSGSERLGRFTNQTHREFIYRMSYEMGRHILGYEIQRVLGAVDCLDRLQGAGPIGVFGYGEGGLIAMYAAALDTRINTTVVSGSFGPRDKIDLEPIYHNVWGLLKEFGDGDVARLIAPRTLIVEATEFRAKEAPAPRSGRGGAAPGNQQAPSARAMEKEVLRIAKHLLDAPPHRGLFFSAPAEVNGMLNLGKTPASEKTLGMIAASMNVGPLTKANGIGDTRSLGIVNPEVRHARQFKQLVDHTQALLAPSKEERHKHFWSKLNLKSLDGYTKSTEALREDFWENCIGKLPTPIMPMNPRSRLVFSTPKWKGYEVVLDLYEDVICEGILLVPNDIKPGEKRPCVVCQHGLEGRPIDVVNPEKKTPYYNSYGARLADRGFIVFAPQNPYIFRNEFRQTVRKANPLGLSLYSFIVRQHERILAWLGALPFVDASRIAFYGLSYGGKTAMRIPSILPGYCLSICSGDFNEWIWKNITLDWVGSYMFTLEYEMYEFNLGNTFNYAEMAALIAPRPFMVERGHSDGVGLDEYVAFEFAKVRRLYAQLGIGDRTEIEFFVGGHEINARATFDFLHRHLRWPAPNQRKANGTP